MVTTIINTTQVDFVTAIVYNSYTGAQTYKNAYFVRNNVVGDDLDDDFKNFTAFDPCLSNPCLNDASCKIGFGNKYVCFCPDSFTGMIFMLFRKNLNVFLSLVLT